MSCVPLIAWIVPVVFDRAGVLRLGKRCHQKPEQMRVNELGAYVRAGFIILQAFGYFPTIRMAHRSAVLYTCHREDGVLLF